MPPGKNRLFSSALQASGLASSKGRRTGPSRRGDGNRSGKSKRGGKGNGSQNRCDSQKNVGGGDTSEHQPREKGGQLLKKGGETGLKHRRFTAQHGTCGKHRKKKKDLKRTRPCGLKTNEGGLPHPGNPGKKRQHVGYGGSPEKKRRGGCEVVSQNQRPGDSTPLVVRQLGSSPTKRRHDGGSAVAARTGSSFRRGPDQGVDGVPARQFTARSRTRIDYGIRLDGINSWLTSKSPVKEDCGDTGAKKAGSSLDKGLDQVNSKGATTGGEMNNSSLDNTVSLAIGKTGPDGEEEKTGPGRSKIISSSDGRALDATVGAEMVGPGDNNRNKKDDSAVLDAIMTTETSTPPNDSEYIAQEQGSKGEVSPRVTEKVSCKKSESGASDECSDNINSSAGVRIRSESIRGEAPVEIRDGPSFLDGAEPQEEEECTAKKVKHDNAGCAAAVSDAGIESKEGETITNGESRVVSLTDNRTHQDETAAEEAGTGGKGAGKECESQATSTSIDEGLGSALQPEGGEEKKGMALETKQALPFLVSTTSPPRKEGYVHGIEVPNVEKSVERQTNEDKHAQTSNLDPFLDRLQGEGLHEERRPNSETDAVENQELPRTVSPLQPVQRLWKQDTANFREVATTHAAGEGGPAKSSAVPKEMSVPEELVPMSTHVSGVKPEQMGPLTKMQPMNEQGEGVHLGRVEIGDQQNSSAFGGGDKECAAAEEVEKKDEQSLLTPPPKPKVVTQADMEYRVKDSADLEMDAENTKQATSNAVDPPQDLPQMVDQELSNEGAGAISEGESGSCRKYLRAKCAAADEVEKKDEQSLLTPSPRPKVVALSGMEYRVKDFAVPEIDADNTKQVTSNAVNVPQDLPQMMDQELVNQGAGAISDGESGGCREFSRPSLTEVARICSPQRTLKTGNESDSHESEAKNGQTRPDDKEKVCHDTKASFTADISTTVSSSSSGKNRKRKRWGISRTEDPIVVVEKESMVGNEEKEGGTERSPRRDSLLSSTVDQSIYEEREQSRTSSLPMVHNDHSQVENPFSDKHRGNDEALKVAFAEEKRHRKDAPSSCQNMDDRVLLNMEININDTHILPKARKVEMSRSRSAPTGSVSEKVWIDDHRHPSAGRSSARSGTSSGRPAGAKVELRRSHSDQGRDHSKRRRQSRSQDRAGGGHLPPLQSRKERTQGRGRSGSHDDTDSASKDQLKKKGGGIAGPGSHLSPRCSKKRSRPGSPSSTLCHQGLGSFSPLIDTEDTMFGSTAESSSWQAMSDPDYFLLLRLGVGTSYRVETPKTSATVRCDEQASLPHLSPEAYALLSSLLDAMGMEPFEREKPEGDISNPPSSHIGDTIPSAIRPMRDRRPTQTPSSVRDFALTQISLLMSVPPAAVKGRQDQNEETQWGVVNEVASMFSLASHLVVRWYRAKTVRHLSEDKHSKAKKAKCAEILRRALMALLAAMRGLLSRLSDQVDADSGSHSEEPREGIGLKDSGMLIHQFFSVPVDPNMTGATNACPHSSCFSCSELLVLDIAILLAELPYGSLGKKHTLSVMRNLISLDSSTLRKKKAKSLKGHSKRTNTGSAEKHPRLEIVRDSIMEHTVRQLLRQEDLDERRLAKELGFSHIAASGAAAALGAQSKECSVMSQHIERYRQEQITFLAEKREKEENQRRMQEAIKLEESWDVDASAKRGVSASKMKQSVPAAVEAPVFSSQEGEHYPTGLLRLDGCIYISHIALKISGLKTPATSLSTQPLRDGCDGNPRRIYDASVPVQDKSASSGKVDSHEEASLAAQPVKSIESSSISMNLSAVTPDSVTPCGKQDKLGKPSESSGKTTLNSGASMLGSDCRVPLSCPQGSGIAKKSLPCDRRDMSDTDSRLLCKRRKLCLTAYRFFHLLVQNQQGYNMVQGEGHISREPLASAALACYLLAGKVEDCPVKISSLLRLARRVQLPPPPLRVLRKWATYGESETRKSRNLPANLNTKDETERGGSKKEELKRCKLDFGDPRAEWIRHYELRLLALVGFEIPGSTDCWHPTTSIESLIEYESTNASAPVSLVFLRHQCSQILHKSCYTHSALCLLGEPYLAAVAIMRLSCLAIESHAPEALNWLDQIAEDDAAPAQILAQHMLDVSSSVKLREERWRETQAVIESIAQRKYKESSRISNKDENTSLHKHLTDEEFSDMIPSHWASTAKIPDAIEEVVRRTNEMMVKDVASVEDCCSMP